MLLKGSTETCVTDPCSNQDAPSVHNGTSWKISAGFYFSECHGNRSGGSYRIGGKSMFCVHLVYGGVESCRALCPLGSEIGETALSPRPRVSRHHHSVAGW